MDFVELRVMTAGPVISYKTVMILFTYFDHGDEVFLGLVNALFTGVRQVISERKCDV